MSNPTCVYNVFMMLTGVRMQLKTVKNLSLQSSRQQDD